jgi:hypothetical protein
MSDVNIPGCAPGTLGDGSDLRVFLLTRGGRAVLAELNPTDGFFTRKLDETSDLELTATVGGVLDQACCDDFTELYQWATEIAVVRDGRDAWVGPVTEIEFQYGLVTVRASDMSAWWDRRFLPSSTFTNVDLATIFAAYHDQALAPDPSPNFTVTVTPSGVIGSRTVNAADAAYASDRMDELSTSAVDWTAYGRTILVGGQEIPATPSVTLLEEFFEAPPIIQILGDEQATRVTVQGTGVSSTAQDDAYIAYYGLLERRFDEPDIRDQASCDAAASGRLEYLKDPTYIKTPSDSALKTTAAVTLPELIPGIRVRVEARSTCREIIRDFRLASVKVQFSGKVSVTLQPLGNVDAAAIQRERD